MRIVGGRLSGRRFPGPPSDATRPTGERVREALASALDARGRLEGARVLELFAGTGALSFEALSRGAVHATLVERDPRVFEALGRSADALGLRADVTLVRADLTSPRGLARVVGPFDLVFCDPPYVDVDVAIARLDELARGGQLDDDALVVLEHARKHAPTSLGEFAPVARYEYGDTSVAFLGRGTAP